MTHPEIVEFASIPQEFLGARLPDRRLHERLLDVAEDLARAPAQPFPQQTGSAARLEGLYRFFNNPRVTLEGVLAGHYARTAQRAAQTGVVLVLHDTTRFELAYAQASEVGFVETGKPGFYGHFSVVLDATEQRQVLGVISLETIHRAQQNSGKGAKDASGGRAARKWKNREVERWGRTMDLASQRLQACDQVIHVADRGADSYDLLSQLSGRQDSYVLRVKSNRRAWEAAHPDLPWSRLWTLAQQAPVVLQREVTLSRRTIPKKWQSKRTPKINRPRSVRQTTLHVAALSVVLDRPNYLLDPFPRYLGTNLVYVFEPFPPSGAERVEWLLYTSEPIETPEQIGRVVDHYRSRWVVEEFFKSLKSGCMYQQRQLESKRGLLNALAVFTPIAVRLLWFRSQAQRRDPGPASAVLTPLEIDVLRRIAPQRLPAAPTARDALWAVAALGGHLKANGEPGWLVIGRGFQTLLTFVEAFYPSVVHTM